MTILKRPPIESRMIFVFLCATCVAASLAAVPTPEEDEPDRTVTEAASVQSGTSGLRVVIDPKTGEIASAQARERSVLSEALAHALSRSTDDLEVFELPSGGVGVHLEGRFQHVVTIKVQVDGSFELECVDSARKANKALGIHTAGPNDASRVR